MGIDEINPEWVRSTQSGSVQPFQSDEASRLREMRGVERADRIEISEEGRTLAELHGTTSADPSTELPPNVIAEIRQRIRDGFYDRPDVATVIAHRLHESGDLPVDPS